MLALKIKFYLKQEMFYGCYIILYDKTKVYKIIGVVSINPNVYEIELSLDLEKIEKLIYKFKLEDGAIFNLTKDLYIKIFKNENLLIKNLLSDKIDFLKGIILEVFNFNRSDEVELKLKYSIEKLGDKYIRNNNISEEKSFKEKLEIIQEQKFYIKVKPVLNNKNGIYPRELKLRDEVFCQVVDKRDIVDYILKILFGRQKDKIICKVYSILKKNNDYFEIEVSITPVIFSKIIAHKNYKIEVKKDA